MQNKNNTDHFDCDSADKNSFVCHEISDTTMDYLHHFTTNNTELHTNKVLKKDRLGRLCSHANSCQLRREGCSADTCFHTYTCEYFCQRFINKND